MMVDETGRRKEEDDERVNWRLAEKMEKILKEKQETAETIEKELEEVTIEQEPEEMKQEPEVDCRVGKRPMEQQEEGPERKRVQVNVKDALALWGQRRSAGGRNEDRRNQGCAGREQETERGCTRGGVSGVAHDPFLDPAAPARERGRG